MTTAPLRCSPCRELPVDIWAKVAYWLPRMPREPLWMAWLNYRRVNRTFKTVIERYYIQFYLRFTWLYINCEATIVTSAGRQSLIDAYRFCGFEGDGKRDAVLSGRQRPDTTPGSEVVPAIQTQIARFKDERGYHPFMAMSVGNEGATDMLPMDLRFNFSTQGNSARFDWRTYFSTVFSELKFVDELRSFNLTYQTALAWNLCRQTAMRDFERMRALVNASGTDDVGVDGRLLAVRRGRRYRIGIKLGQLVPKIPGRDVSVWDDRFSRRDEEHVAKMLLDFQRIVFHRWGRVFAW